MSDEDIIRGCLMDLTKGCYEGRDSMEYSVNRVVSEAMEALARLVAVREAATRFVGTEPNTYSFAVYTDDPEWLELRAAVLGSDVSAVKGEDAQATKGKGF